MYMVVYSMNYGMDTVVSKPFVRMAYSTLA